MNPINEREDRNARLVGLIVVLSSFIFAAALLLFARLGADALKNLDKYFWRIWPMPDRFELLVLLVGVLAIALAVSLAVNKKMGCAPSVIIVFLTVPFLVFIQGGFMGLVVAFITLFFFIGAIGIMALVGD